MDLTLDWMNESVPEAECSSGILKTDAELAQWSTQEGISEGDKGVQLLESGLPPQKIWALNNLDIVIKEGGSRILSRIFSQIMSWDEQMQIASGIGFLSAVKKRYIPKSFFQDTLELTLTFLSFYSRTVLEVWMPVFDSLISQTSVDLIKSKAIPMIILLSDYTQKPISRQVSCQLLNSLAEVLGKEFKGQILQRSKALSQDTNADVRQEMCRSWLSIAKVVGTSVIEEIIFFEAVKLVHDTTTDVKAEAIGLFIQLLPYLSYGFLVSQAMPIIKNELFIEMPISIQIKLSQHIGQLFISIKSILSKEDRASCVEMLTRLANSDTIVRKNLAFNIPGIFLALGACKNLKTITTQLASDEDAEIRTLIAAGLHEIVRQDPSCKIVRKVSTQLYENPQTQLSMLKSMQHWQCYFQPSELLTKFVSLVNSTNWRTQLLYLSQIKETFLQFPMKDVVDIFIPLLIYKMQSGSWPLKISSAELLAHILYHNYYMARKLDICNILKDKFARSNNCNDRLVFLYFIEYILPLQSKQFFSLVFADDTIRLGNDNVSSVRIKFSTMIPQIRESLQNQYITQLNNILSILVEDPLQTVRESAQFSKNILKSDEYNNKLQSEETMKNEQKKLKFEEEQGGQEAREQDEKKKRMVDELAAKARADMQQSKSGMLKTRPSLGKVTRPEVSSTSKLPKANLKQPIAVKKKMFSS